MPYLSSPHSHTNFPRTTPSICIFTEKYVHEHIQDNFTRNYLTLLPIFQEAQFAITTPYFEKGLASGAVLSHVVWIVGPLSGLIIAPIVGTLSDRCTSPWGRRRPFILAGLCTTVIGMLSFSNASRIAACFFTAGSQTHHLASNVVAVVAFCILDLAINTTMWPGLFYPSPFENTYICIY